MRDEKGQSTVEYILLFVVIISITLTIFESAGFKRIFGQNGTLATTYRNQIEFSYRHGFLRSGPNTEPNYQSGEHESYQGRFFSSKDPYPAN